MKRIPLTQGQFALVDDKDFGRISAHKWYAHWNKYTRSFYATRALPRESGKQKKIVMHQEVIAAVEGTVVDHVNHNTLDNQRSNLRLCSASQNRANARINIRTASGLKGVSRSYGKWRARIQVDRKVIVLGVFVCAIKAAKAYDSAARMYFGKFALTNKMMGLLP